MRKSEENFFNRLYTDSYPLLKRYVCRKADTDDVEDILQETYYKAYLNIELLIRHENPMGWLMVTCKNTLLKQITRKSKILEKTFTIESEDVLEKIPYTDCYDHIYMDELRKILSQETYFLLVKKYIEGFSVEELARELNITDGACKMRLKRAKKEAEKKILIFLLLFLFLEDYIY